MYFKVMLEVLYRNPTPTRTYKMVKCSITFNICLGICVENIHRRIPTHNMYESTHKQTYTDNTTQMMLHVWTNE